MSGLYSTSSPYSFLYLKLPFSKFFNVNEAKDLTFCKAPTTVKITMQLQEIEIWTKESLQP